LFRKGGNRNEDNIENGPGFDSDKDSLCTLGSNYFRKKAPGTKLYGRLQKQSHKAEKLSWVQVPLKMFCVSQKLNTMEEKPRIKVFMPRKIQFHRVDSCGEKTMTP
jgi:hypothetical protein